VSRKLGIACAHAVTKAASRVPKSEVSPMPPWRDGWRSRCSAKQSPFRLEPMATWACARMVASKRAQKVLLSAGRPYRAQ
jgi:hypothetical protein